MESLDYKRLERNLIQILENYLADPENASNREKARLLYFKYVNAMPLLGRKLQRALAMLVDIGWTLGSAPKPTKSRVKQLLQEMK